MATPEQVAHTLRRTGFGFRPGQIDSLLGTDIHDLIDERLADEGWSLSEDETNARDLDEPDWDQLPKEWMERIMSRDAGMHERMVWFWHNHFTTNRHETSHKLVWRQHQTIRRNALGNVRELAAAMLVDGAMLHFLDADGSKGDQPNENLSREFMELFMLGRNAGYTEDDVRAGARILSGWYVDWETGEIGFNSEDSYQRPVQFLGRRRRWNLDTYLDAVLAQPTCAGHIAGKLHDHFVSTPLSDERRAELGEVLRSNDWEIRPLLAELLHHDDFVNGLGVRTLEPVEWFASAAALVDLENAGEENGWEFWQVYEAGQVPFEPPNVAGWMNDERWSSANQVMSRGNALLNWRISDRIINSLEPSTTAVLEHCGIYAPSDATVAALDRAIGVQTEYDKGLELLLSLALLSPEFSTI